LQLPLGKALVPKKKAITIEKDKFNIRRPAITKHKNTVIAGILLEAFLRQGD